MGRGLSPLQEWILREARQRRRIYSADILAGFFGWQPSKPMDRHQTGEQAGELKYPADYYFSAIRIGARKHQRTVATVSRSCKRLQERGLVKRVQGTPPRWPGVEITEEGRRALSIHLAAQASFEESSSSPNATPSRCSNPT
jgi:hypothetical protein